MLYASDKLRHTERVDAPNRLFGPILQQAIDGV
jgi:hypothetical protein